MPLPVAEENAKKFEADHKREGQARLFLPPKLLVYALGVFEFVAEPKKIWLTRESIAQSLPSSQTTLPATFY